MDTELFLSAAAPDVQVGEALRHEPLHGHGVGGVAKNFKSVSYRH